MAILQTHARVIPGVSDVIETLEREITWGTWEVNKTWIKGVQLDPAAIDTGNTGQTHILRPGLSMGYYSDTKLATTWGYDATGANFLGFLLYAESTRGPMRQGSEVGKWFGYVLVGGQVRTKDVIINAAPVSTSPTYGYGNLNGSDNEAALRSAWTQFMFDDFADEFSTTNP